MPQTPTGRPTGLPRNVCQFFWTSGACSRGFECSYRHVKQSGGGGGGGRGQPEATAAPSPPPGGEASTVVGVDDDPDFFSPEGLAVGAGSVREGHHALDPSEVHNHLKEFLRDGYQFEGAGKVQGFVRLLASVNDRNKTWNTESAQEFLGTVVKGNALHRIGDALRFHPVSVSIGSHTGALSFQRGYFPLFQFFASDLVLKSTLHKNVNSLYAVLKDNHDYVFRTLQACLNTMMTAMSWKDKTPILSASLQNNLDGVTIFRALSTLFLQYFNRFKDAIRNDAQLPQFIQQFAEWFEYWATDVSSPSSCFQDPIASAPPNNRKLTIDHIREEIRRLQAIVERETGTVQRLRRGPAVSTLTPAQRSAARVTLLAQTYDPPGSLRTDGPRHDNDFEDIERIKIAPTHGEIFSPVPPYLPVFSSDAPHHMPADSIERHLDIQFRLLREELISTTRSSLVAIQDDLLQIWNSKKTRPSQKDRTLLERVVEKKGGAYRTSGRDSVFFQVYTNVEFAPSPPEAQRRGLTVGLVVDAPPAGAARDKNAKNRVAYWEHSKRLQGASLVALVVVSDRIVRVYLGVVCSFSKDIAESAKLHEDRVHVRVSFFEPEVELMALRGDVLCTGGSHPARFAVLVDNGVMFDSVRPFLQKLQTIEPRELPFARYIAPARSVRDVEVLPPKYALAPGFKFNLQCLAKDRTYSISPLVVSDPLAVARARDQLRTRSILDPSQAEAVVDTLTREVSLIQGPPGTGKSFTAKEILRVLFASKIRPIVLIAYTNHALDHMVTSVLDANITNKLVRLGTRSTDERIAEYTLDKLERMATATTLDRSIKRQYAVMKELEQRMAQTMTSIRLPLLSWKNIEAYLDIHYMEHAEGFHVPPYWVAEFVNLKWAEEEEEGEFRKVENKRNKKSKTVESNVERTIYGIWRDGVDLHFVQQQPMHAPQPDAKGKGKGKTQADIAEATPQSLLVNPLAFFATLGFFGLPPVPNTTRSLAELQRNPNVWQMSFNERQRLAEDWERKIRNHAYTSYLDRYKSLKEKHREACKEYDDMKDEIRRRLLSQTDLIACTTTGAASLTSLLSSIAPKVLMVEEAGQVLEAHILTSLGPSVRHLICIGDPQQLRPTLATFTLSMDSAIGRDLYKFDRSLMERLSDNGFPMSQINVQRRMRPTISHFIRQILYPKLEYNQLVTEYPAVVGMQKDVFFFNHLNKENGTEDSVSKYNTFEVEMVKNLVLYFLRQGSYSGPGDIAVLCAYLGQLQKVRAALRDLKIAVAVDERDAEQLARQGIDEDVDFEEVLVAKHVKLGTVDIFQGQEAKIVIVSLVRNSGQIDTGGSAQIGFLKSVNRINVALSRAKHGLYVLGNAANLRQNAAWSTILDEMEHREQIGPALPIICPRHPEQARLISQPRELSLYAPNGGCLIPCDARLSCGHICPSTCHAAPDNHRSVKCLEPCMRTPCPRAHPCSKRCSDDCGNCDFPMYKVTLPCGHTAAKIPCYMMEDLKLVKCSERVLKPLPKCEHSAFMACHRDPSLERCREPCSGALQCCSKTCKAACGDCQSHTIHNTNYVGGKVARTHHIGHPCDRMLYCQHKCGLQCSQDHQCNTSCREPCRQQCIHHKCPKPCSDPCAPCMEPCPWSCAHLSCPVLCGSICSRLPCDEICQKLLECGHPCPSVCGEPCTVQKCVVCLPADGKADIVDFVMQRRLEEIDLESTDVSDRLITLACGHIFTVETLDGHCNMSDYYNIDDMGRFMSTKSPPVNYQTPPVCPTCRGPITALRYGRVTKRATLDILEQNVASTMSSALEACSPSISEFATTLSALQDQAKALKTLSTKDDEPPQPKPDSFSSENGPLPVRAIEVKGMQDVHGLLQEEAQAWNKIKIATTRGAHVKAYEAALNTLYHLEMREIEDDPLRATDAPEPLALIIVNHKIGQAPPKADVRFQIEAYFLTFELRSILAQVAQSRVEGIPAASDDEDVARSRQLWTAFVAFLYSSCITDANKAIALAESSSATRQAVRSAVHKLRFEFELFRWTILCERADFGRAGTFGQRERNELSLRIKSHKVKMFRVCRDLQQDYIRKRPSSTMEDLKEQRRWLDENCRNKVDMWQTEATKLEEYVMKDGFYQPMTLQEREDIVKAFGFTHRGHFYNCENGHTFVITECGGAMESARCPECNCPIGGSNHRLTSSNTRATEYEQIAGKQGSLAGVWAWARDA